MSTKLRRILSVMLLAFALAVPLLGPIAAVAADSSACYNIGSSDARAYCLAKARGEASQCYSIQRGDLRAQCLAEVRR